MAVTSDPRSSLEPSSASSQLPNIPDIPIIPCPSLPYRPSSIAVNAPSESTGSSEPPIHQPALSAPSPEASPVANDNLNQRPPSTREAITNPQRRSTRDPSPRILSSKATHRDSVTPEQHFPGNTKTYPDNITVGSQPVPSSSLSRPQSLSIEGETNIARGLARHATTDRYLQIIYGSPGPF